MIMIMVILIVITAIMTIIKVIYKINDIILLVILMITKIIFHNNLPFQFSLNIAFLRLGLNDENSWDFNFFRNCSTNCSSYFMLFYHHLHIIYSHIINL